MDSDRIEIDWDQFKKLCALHATQEEIADFFKCSHDTIGRRVKEKFGKNFKEVWKQHVVHTKVALRRKQIELALDGNTTMLAHLGKYMLDQKLGEEMNVNIGLSVEDWVKDREALIQKQKELEFDSNTGQIQDEKSEDEAVPE